MAPIAKLAAVAVFLLIADVVRAFHFPSSDSHSDHTDAIRRRQATRAQVVRRAQEQFANGMRPRNQPSMTPCPVGQVTLADNSCCPSAQFSTVQSKCCSSAATSVNGGGTCCSENVDPLGGCNTCPAGQEDTCDGCCDFSMIVDNECCKPPRGTLTKDGKCCPQGSIDENTGNCDCQDISPGTSVNTCNDPTAVRRDLSSNPRNNRALHPREVAELLVNHGHFKRDGEWVEDKLYERNLPSGTRQMLARAASSVVNRMPPSWLAQHTHRFFSNPDRLFPLSDSHRMLVADLPQVLDLMLEDPEFDTVVFRTFSLGRPHLEAIRENIPFQYDNSTFGAPVRLNRRSVV